MLGIQILVLLIGVYLIETIFIGKKSPNSQITEIQRKYFWAIGIAMLSVGLFLLAITALYAGINIIVLIVFFSYLSLRFLSASYESYKN